MAIYEKQATVKPGSRSNTKLVVSGGFSPAEHFITDSTLDTLFHYEYGGPGQKEVVISKGMLVSVKPDAEIDYESGKSKTVLTRSGNVANKVVGMAPYNYSRHTKDFFDGNQPAIITREYVELPYIPNGADAAAMKFGAVTGAGLKIGDLITFSRTAENFGQAIKWQEGTHAVSEIVGQVLGLEMDQEIQGWLKWALWDDAAKNEDLGADKAGYNAPPKGGFPFDANYREGVQDLDGYLDQYTTNPTGVKGLLDGENRAQTQLQTGTFAIASATGIIVNKDLGYKNIVDKSVSFVGATLTEVGTMAALVNETFYVDYKNGQVYYKSAVAAATASIQFKAHFYGTPAGLDFKGVSGAARILLRF